MKQLVNKNSLHMHTSIQYIFNRRGFKKDNTEKETKPRLSHEAFIERQFAILGEV